MGTQARAIPAPNFDSKIHDSTIQTKANPWLEVIQERSSSQLYGVRKQKRDYDRPKGEYGRPFGNGNHHDEDFGGGGQPSFHKKQKIDKRDQIDYNYYCDACDRGFKTAEQEEIHTKQHERCRVADCNYIAAPKLVKLHYDMQHRTGLAKKIKESSEDIEKWREERRRNFPTAENVRRKKEEMLERQERGDVLETKQFGKMNQQRGRGRGRGRGGMRGRGAYRNNYQPHNMSQQTQNGRSVEGANLDPLSRLAGECEVTPQSYINHDDDWDTKPTPSAVTQTPQSLPTTASATNSTSTQANALSSNSQSTQANALSSNSQSTQANALSSLVGNYGDVSSSEEDEEAAQIKKTTTSTSKPDGPPSQGQSNGTTQEKVCPTSTDNSKPTIKSQEPLKPNNQPADKKKSEYTGYKPKPGPSTVRSQQRHTQSNYRKGKSTLLEKLLASEIRHERNVLLQCIRHVVNQDFFGIGSTKSQSGQDQPNSYNDDVWD